MLMLSFHPNAKSMLQRALVCVCIGVGEGAAEGPVLWGADAIVLVGCMLMLHSTPMQKRGCRVCLFLCVLGVGEVLRKGQSYGVLMQLCLWAADNHRAC